MAACLSLQKKQHICNCFYQTAIVDLSDREIELQIAYFEKDNPKQAAIRSEPGFDYDAYNAKAEASLLKTLACVKDAKK